MIKAETLIKLPQNFRDICHVYPPSVKDVLENDNKGLQYEKILTETYEEIHDEFTEDNPNMSEDDIPSPFKFLLANCYASEDAKLVYLKAFNFFLKEPVTIVPELEVIIVGCEEETLDPDVDLEEPRVIYEEDFFDFQNFIREAMGSKKVTEVEDFENELPQIKRMKKLGRKRDRIAKKNSNKNGTSFDTILLGLCCSGIGLTPLNIGEIAYASATSLSKMLQARESYDTDMHLIYAGADAKKIKPQYWVRDFTDD